MAARSVEARRLAQSSLQGHAETPPESHLEGAGSELRRRLARQLKIIASPQTCAREPPPHSLEPLRDVPLLQRTADEERQAPLRGALPELRARLERQRQKDADPPSVSGGVDDSSEKTRAEVVPNFSGDEPVQQMATTPHRRDIGGIDEACQDPAEQVCDAEPPVSLKIDGREGAATSRLTQHVHAVGLGGGCADPVVCASDEARDLSGEPCEAPVKQVGDAEPPGSLRNGGDEGFATPRLSQHPHAGGCSSATERVSGRGCADPAVCDIDEAPDYVGEACEAFAKLAEENPDGTDPLTFFWIGDDGPCEDLANVSKDCGRMADDDAGAYEYFELEVAEYADVVAHLPSWMASWFWETVCHHESLRQTFDCRLRNVVHELSTLPMRSVSSEEKWAGRTSYEEEPLVTDADVEERFENIMRSVAEFLPAGLAARLLQRIRLRRSVLHQLQSMLGPHQPDPPSTQSGSEAHNPEASPSPARTGVAHAAPLGHRPLGIQHRETAPMMQAPLRLLLQRVLTAAAYIFIAWAVLTHPIWQRAWFKGMHIAQKPPSALDSDDDTWQWGLVETGDFDFEARTAEGAVLAYPLSRRFITEQTAQQPPRAVKPDDVIWRSGTLETHGSLLQVGAVEGAVRLHGQEAEETLHGVGPEDNRLRREAPTKQVIALLLEIQEQVINLSILFVAALLPQT